MFMRLSGKVPIMKPNGERNTIMGRGLGTSLPSGDAGVGWSRIKTEKSFEKSVFCGLL